MGMVEKVRQRWRRSLQVGSQRGIVMLYWDCEYVAVLLVSMACL